MQYSTVCFCVFNQMPQTTAEWLQIADGFEAKSNFPHCIGALDGKHISIIPPPNSGSLYYNYKHHFSIVLLALVDSHCRFLFVDIGAHGRTSDGGVYHNSSLAHCLEANTLNIPQASVIPPTNDHYPYVIVADDAFALKPYILKPYAQRNQTPEQRIFNYRLSRARRSAENAFGQLSQRFRIFGRPIPLSPAKVNVIVMASCCLHNFLLRDKVSAATYMPEGEQGNESSTQFSPLSHQGGNRSSAEAQNIRDKFSHYFNSADGEIQGQAARAINL